MRRINFSQNWNGKLLCDCFTTIRLWQYGKYPDNELYEVVLQGKILGTATIECLKAFYFNQITTQMALIDTGHEPYYLQQLLRNFYGELKAEQPLYMIVFKWKTRDQEATQELTRQWISKLIKQADPEAQEQTLFKS